MELLRQQVAQLQEHAAGLEATVAQLEAELQAARSQVHSSTQALS